MICRGDLVRVSLRGKYGKPRPALVVQSDFLAALESLVICPITSDLREATFRVTVEPTAANRLERVSQVMVDKISTLPRAKVSNPFGRIASDKMRSVEWAILLVTDMT